MTGVPAPGLHGLPPGVDFPRAFVAGLMAQMQGTPPEALARITIYLNAPRMKRAVQAAFAEHGALLLPRLRLVTDIGADPVAPLPPAIPALRRRLELAQLVAGLTTKQPDIAAGPSRFALADSLAALLSEMQMEGVLPADLAGLDVASHAAHWQRNLTFVNLIARFFDDAAAPDASARQARATDLLIARWQHSPPRDPVIVAGSTGSRGATRRLMQAVAALPNGTVVLPGFDFDLPAPAWAALDQGGLPAEDHPQFRFIALLQAAGISAAQMPVWPAPGLTGAPAPARAALVSMALRPAPVTDQWMQEGPQLPDLSAAMEQVTLIEAPDPRLEAAAIALILRESAGTTGRTAALITPDRALARRVTAALDRWHIIPDDSAGEPLHHTPAGRLMRHICAAFGRRIGVETVLILLKHPLTARGWTRGPHLLFSRELELHLRRHGPAFPEPGDLLAWAGADPERGDWARWLGAVIAALTRDEAERPLADWLDDLRAAAELIARGPAPDGAGTLWDKPDGAACRSLLEGLADEAGAGGTLAPADFAALVSGLMAGVQVRESRAADPRVLIRGTLEARVAEADTVILGGLTEGTWPEQPGPDPWLSRPMRAQAGLLLPERRIGLQAHDFQQAVSASRVVLSRARRSADADTVPSRWLNRITSLLGGLPAQNGPHLLDEARKRGDKWLALATAIDAPRDDLPAAVTTRAPRPAPRPPLADRPRRLPVTDIPRLLRDPYAIYARRILRLRPLDPLRPEPGAALRGIALHRVAELFVAHRPEAETPDEARARLLAIAEEVLEAEIPWPAERRFWLARVAGIADALIAAEQARQPAISASHVEVSGRMALPAQDFTLTAEADRIDCLRDGTLAIMDYKTGAVPSATQAERYDRQLFLEALIAAAGGFEAVGAAPVSDLRYIRLGGDARETALPADPATLARMQALLVDLIAAYDRAETGYIARRAMHKQDDHSDYDRLSRFGEWALSDPSSPEDLV